MNTCLTVEEKTILPELISVLMQIPENKRQFIYGYTTALKEVEEARNKSPDVVDKT